MTVLSLAEPFYPLAAGWRLGKARTKIVALIGQIATAPHTSPKRRDGETKSGTNTNLMQFSQAANLS